MTAVREALVLPFIFLTVALLGGLEPGASFPWSFASPFSLLLAILMMSALVRSGALAPERLMHQSRGSLANSNGLVVLVTLFTACAQVLHMLTPRAGLPSLIVGVVLLLLLVNTLAAAPDRRRMLRSIAVVVGSAFVLKFIVLAALVDPAGSRTKRVLQALFDAATLGTIAQAPLHPAAAYVAFFTAVLYLIGVAILPRGRAPENGDTHRFLPAGDDRHRSLPPHD